MVAVKLLPHILTWVVLQLLLVRGCPVQRRLVAVVGNLGFLCATITAFSLPRLFADNAVFTLLKISVAACFVLFWAIAVAALYQSTGRPGGYTLGSRLTGSAPLAGLCSLITGAIAGAICGVKFVAVDGTPMLFTALVGVAVVLALLITSAERLLPVVFLVPPTALAASVSGLLLFGSSSILRLDLFSPLTMKVMKFAHDFVHQFFESMLIPDHLFFSAALWNCIGFLFGNGVGFWGALFLWLTPAVLILVAVRCEPLPAVAHVRQGAGRRKLIAAAISLRKRKMAVPFCALAIYAGAVYQSRFPRVEYWDPKPIAVSASTAGEIVIPKKGEVDLEDGKLHKYSYSRGGKEARFFIVVTPDGKLTAVLDACSICKPDGYGQAEGTVVCYYCKTLIPLDTVGKPGGCNPVPMPYLIKNDGVHIDALTLINIWENTTQGTKSVKGGEK